MRVRYGLAGVLGASLVAVLISTAHGAQPRTISTASLLAEMTDLAGMAEFPEPAYTTWQSSSYDPASKSPKENWFANGDCGHYIRVEERDGRKEFVMADMKGPGAVVRIWSANPAGIIRFYIDGAEKPALEARMTDLLGGKFPGLPQPIAGERSKGWNLYFPIPYATSCKITGEGVAEKNHRMYYHVNYRTYAPGTTVASFTLQQLQGLAGQVEQAAQKLASPREAADIPVSLRFNVGLGANGTGKQSLSGAQAIRQMTLKVKADNLEAALRGVILRMTFDGQKTVESPLGDFFGTAPGVNPYAALPCGVTKDGEFWSRWVMPFRAQADLEFQNTTGAPVSIEGTLSSGTHQWTDRSMYFHAKWRADFDVPTRPMIDWNYLTVKGKGVFAGVAFAIDNPVKDWWGEGDEKIYFDGQTFPSHFGTGTEDYFGYAWCWPGLFTHAYHNQPRCDGPGNFGRTSVNRFHILDRIPFNTDFRFDMELWHWHQTCKVNMAVVSYWYALAGATDGFKAIRAEEVVLRPAPEIQIVKVKGAIEGEKMRIIQKTGNPAPQDWDGLSEGRQLWWHDTPKPGDTLVLGFDVPKAGRYQVVGRFLKAIDYGIVQLAVNDQKAGEPIDFFNEGVVPTPEITLGTFELKEGENRFSATIVGANERAIKSYMFGLDYLLLKPVE